MRWKTRATWEFIGSLGAIAAAFYAAFIVKFPLATALTAIGLFLGYGAFWETRTRARYRNLLEETQREIQSVLDVGRRVNCVLPNGKLERIVRRIAVEEHETISEGEADRAQADCSGTREKRHVRQSEWVVLAIVSDFQDLQRITSLVQTLDKAVDDATVGEALARVRLYTVFARRLEHRRDVQSLRQQVGALRSCVNGDWYYLPFPVFTSTCLVWNFHGSAFSNAHDTENWADLSFVNCLHAAISKGVNALRGLHCPLLVSAHQVLRASELAHQAKEDHFDDFDKDGFHFGKYGELLPEPAKLVLKHGKMSELQRLEDREFTDFMRELLPECKRVTAFWPLVEDSLRYVTASPINEWQNIIGGQLSTRSDGFKVERYLLVWVKASSDGSYALYEGEKGKTGPEGGLFGLDSEDADARHFELPYDKIVECVVGRYFWEWLNRGLDLYILPAPFKQISQVQHAFEERLGELDKTISPSLRKDVQAALTKDWVMLSPIQNGPVATIAQYDRAVESTMHGGASRLLVHRYAFANAEASEVCDGAAKCVLQNHRLIAPYCCLRRVLRSPGGIVFPPQRFLSSTVTRGVIERIKRRREGFYRADEKGNTLTWTSLLEFMEREAKAEGRLH